MNINKRIFREYDIRGKADTDLHSDLVRDLGRALISELSSKHPTLCVGYDCRTSSPRLKDALIEGLRQSGADVLDIGVVASPVLYFAAHHFESDASIIVTGSHNPSDENGFKMLRGTASMHGDDIKNLLARILESNFRTSDQKGSIKNADATTPYLEHAYSKIKLGNRRPKVVIDAGNGTGGPIAESLYTRLGFEVIPLYCDMDGTFPNHHPDPTVEKNLEDLKNAVKEHGAELGLAFDGDADRLGAVDSQGRVLWGDQLMILFGREILKEHPGATFIGEVKCSQSLYDELAAVGGHPIMWKVGHSLIKDKLKKEKAMLAGEMSGHLFFAHRYLGFDDGVYAGARLLELLSHSDTTLAEHYDTLPIMVNTPEIRIECSDDEKFDLVEGTKNKLSNLDEVKNIVDIDGVRAQFADGWALVRASNTQASLVTRYEASNAETLHSIQTLVEATIASLRAL